MVLLRAVPADSKNEENREKWSLLFAEYDIDETNEIFTMDDVGNRSSVNLKDGNDVSYSND
jgi:hypothetical protein